GGWGGWGEWTSCSRTCGYGSIQRSRQWIYGDGMVTNYTYTSYGECWTKKPCPSSFLSTSFLRLHYEVHGKWSMWTAWSPCPVMCGGGTIVRKRLCNNPTPGKGGDFCEGNSTEVESCNNATCPVRFLCNTKSRNIQVRNSVGDRKISVVVVLDRENAVPSRLAMLPTIRNRKSGSVKNSMAGVGSIVIDATSKLRRLPFRMKCFLIGIAFVSIYVYGSLFFTITSNHLKEESYLETVKCPACYGHSACIDLKDGLISMKGWSRLRFLDFVNLKNVHVGEHDGIQKSVILKKLAHDRELQQADEQICLDANRPVTCDVGKNLMKTKTGNDIMRNGLLPVHLKGLSYMFACPTYNLLDRILKYYKEKMRANVNHVFSRDKLQIYGTARINQEPLLLQTFPASEGWPFPKYYGACGRFIVVENGGDSMEKYYNAPFHVRADLAYQVMKIAERLTNTGGNFVLYWTDVSYENLVVDSAGKVMVVDVENVIVVDRLAVHKVKPSGYDDLHESNFDDCGGRNCLSFSTENLCSHLNSDHNYFAACRNLLSKYANEADIGMPDGLLHDMPNYAKDDWDLEHLLNECVHPSGGEGRLKAKNKLLQALDVLRNVKDHKDVVAGERL
ncbi:hypothetical protein FSP39_014457, partial [Pinctada imbricata]